MLGTTAQAVLRARGLLMAWDAGDADTFASILRVAERPGPEEPAAFVNTTVALVAVADRLLDYVGNMPEPHPGAHNRAALLAELQNVCIAALNLTEGDNS